MNKSRLIISLLIIQIAFISTLRAQLEIKGEFRPRTEFSHGYKSLSAEDQVPSIFTSQRTRINFHYKNDKVKTGLVLQDVRNWGNQPQLVTNEDFGISIHEAWAEIFFSNKLSLKAGRQELVYDDHRIFGNVGWAQQARSHDLALFKYEEGIKIHLGFAYNENNEITNNYYFGPDAYKSMQFLWLNKKYKSLDISLLFLNNGIPFPSKQDTSVIIIDQGINFSQTVGPRVVYKKNKIQFATYFYYQMGEDASEKDINAYDLSAEIGYNATNKLDLSAGIEILSGTDYNVSKYNNSFTPLYGTNHKFNGFMDYFFVGNHINSVGLQDIYIKSNYKFNRSFIAANGHIFSSSAKINADKENYLGTEIDIFAGYNITNDANIKIGYSHMIASSSMEILKGGNKDELNNWAWIMVTVTPTFFNSIKSN